MLFTTLLFKVTSWMCALVHVPSIIISTYPPKNTEKGFYILSTSLLISRKPNSQVIKKE